MFQNINEYTIQEQKKETVNKWSEVFKRNNIIMYVISFMLSLVSIGGDFSLFSISILGACFSSSVPLLGVVIISLIGNLLKFGVGGRIRILFNKSYLLLKYFYLKTKIQ